MRRAASQVTFLGSFTETLPTTGLPEVAFAGRSNVGKSSALNRLLGQRKAARVSSTPGRTQAINLFQLSDALCFADLPGYGYAKVPEHVAEAWGPMIEAYLGERKELRLVVLLVDARLPAQESDRDLIEGLEPFELPVVVLATKLDKLSKHQRKPMLAALAEGLGLDLDQILGFSSKTGEGSDEVWDVITTTCRREATR